MACSRCGSITDNISDFCPVCGGIAKNVQQKKLSEPATVSWESSSARNFPVSALIDTIQELFFRTDQFFAKVNSSKANRSALLFGMVTGSIGMLSEFIWSYLLPDLSFDSQTQLSQSAQLLIFTPIILSFQILLVTIYIQLMLFFTKARNAPVASTFRITCYSLGAFVLYAIPVIGVILAAIMWCYFIITGIHQIHFVSKWKAAMVLIFPFIALFLLFFIILTMIIIGSIIAGNSAIGSFPFF